MEPVKGGTLVNLPPQAEKKLRDYNPQASLASWAIRFAAGLDGVFIVLSGMNTMDQVVDNTSYMANFHPINAEEQQILDRVVEIIHKDTAIPCTTCRYCEEGCPEHIAIPDYFSLYI